MTPSEKLKRARFFLGIKAASKVDEKLGYPDGRTASYEKGRAKPSEEYLLRFQNAYGIPAAWLMDGQDNMPPGMQPSPVHDDIEDATGEPPESAEPLMLPMYGDVPAGEWDESEADPDWYEVEQDIYDSRRFYRRISGDSMSPKLRSGDLVLMHPATTPRDNVIVLAQNGDGRKTVKVCRYIDNEWVLVPINPNHQMQKLQEWELVAFLVVVKRTLLKGLQVRFRCDVGIQPEMLPDD